MLSRILDMDNVVFRFFRKLGYVWWLHILWLVCSLPVITMGASTTALCYSCMKLHEKDEAVSRNFFHSFKENFRQSTILFLVFLVIGGVLLFDLVMCGQMDSLVGHFVKYGAIALMIPYLIMLLYVFALQAKFVNPVSKTIKYSLLVAGKYFGYTLQMVLIVGGLLALNTTIVLANFMTLSMGIGAAAYILASYYNKIFMKIMAQTEMDG